MSERSLTVLVVDDEPELRDALSRLLGREGYEVTLAADGRSAIDLALATPFDVILLDVALGAGPAGYEVCRTLREQRIVAPIVMLTALDSEGDAVLALEAGADDYVRKPFGPTELRSRLRAVLRRGSLRAESETTRTLGEVSVDPGRGVVLRNGSEVSLTHAERVVLETLTARPGQVFTREQLLGAIWGDADHRDPHLVDAHIHRLRVKLEDDASQPRLIQTVRGVGYRAAQG